jgi:arylsulfatase A-like enzyme
MTLLNKLKPKSLMWLLCLAIILAASIYFFSLWKSERWSLEKKKITPFHRLVNKQIKLTPFELANERRWALKSSIFATYEFKAKIPPQGYLKFGIGIDPQWQKTYRQGITFRISIINDGKSWDVFSTYYDGNTWQDFKIKLDHFAGEIVTIKFLTAAEVGHSNSKPALWADPRIISALRLKEEINILLISIDSLRADHLGVYGYKRPTSPNIDQLAREGATLNQMYAQRSLTWPSLTSIMTSLYPNTHGVIRNGYKLKKDTVSLDVILKDYGYDTASFLANYWDTLTRGFTMRKHSTDFGITKEGIKWLSSKTKNKFFLWLHYLNPHFAYEPIPPYDKMFDPSYKGTINGKYLLLNEIMTKNQTITQRDLKHVIALYDGEIRQTDHLIGTLLDVLNKFGLKENTLVIITADHGEELYQHHNYFYHHASVYDSCLHIPCILRLPGIINENIKIDNSLESIDILPTILDILKAPYPADFQGESFYPLLQNKKIHEKKPVQSQFENKIYTIRNENWKYIYNPTDYRILALSSPQEKYIQIHKEELYDIMHDPQEITNLAPSNRVIKDKLKKQLLTWIKNNNNKRVKNQAVNEELLRKLRALGYN